jgi:methylated-DNA-protein-cysteine methyltransferase-like protein
MEQLWKLIQQIPRGCVASYGSLGKCLNSPVSGLIVGRWMTQVPEDVPWWRVVAKNGSLPIFKRNPWLVEVQYQKLLAEGVAFDRRSVLPQYFWDPLS